jgi:hypothetical protein
MLVSLQPLPCIADQLILSQTRCHTQHAHAGRKDCLGAWWAWGDCSAACGDGTQTRTYTVASPAKAGGGACPAVSGQVEARACNLQPCPANCTGTPLAGGTNWDCFTAAGTAHGAVCAGACLEGELGQATAVCNDGAYEPVQGCHPGE